MTGRMYDEGLGKLHFWLTFVFFNLTFGPMHLIGVEGMPRRVYDYAGAVRRLQPLHLDRSFVLGVATLIFAYNIVSSWRGGPRAAANPWRALTLEWQVSSPPPIFNFDRVPTVVGGPYEYGVPGAVHGVFKARRPKRGRDSRAGAPESESRDVTKILVVANETVAGKRMLDAMRRRTAARTQIPPRRAADAPEARQRHLRRRGARRAQLRIDLARAFLREQGIESTGEVGDEDPLPRRRTRSPSPADEIIVSTLPGDRLGLAAARPARAPPRGDRPAGRARRHRPRAGGPRRSTSRSSSPTGRSAARLLAERLKQRRDEGPRRFIAVVPQEGGARRRRRPGARAAGRAARVAAPARASWPRGMIGDPDPYDAIMNALQFFTIDEIVISTLPGTTSAGCATTSSTACARPTDSTVEHVESRRRRPATA